jgi:hypothetical protein
MYSESVPVEITLHYAKFQVYTVMEIQFVVIWVVTPSWRQHGTSKRWLSTTSLHGVTIYETTIYTLLNCIIITRFEVLRFS